MSEKRERKRERREGRQRVRVGRHLPPPCSPSGDRAHEPPRACLGTAVVLDETRTRKHTTHSLAPPFFFPVSGDRITSVLIPLAAVGASLMMLTAGASKMYVQPGKNA